MRAHVTNKPGRKGSVPSGDCHTSDFHEKDASKRLWFEKHEASEYRRQLLNWYDHTHRVLPWRRTPHSKKTPAVKNAAVIDDEHNVELNISHAPADLPEQQFAYWVWVSEVMLQQTQVATVIPYFTRWVGKWPTVADLAAADIDSVNTMWAGLGYYRRARYLLDGARYVVEKLDGQFPTTATELLKIPGVGPYTSAAVASIAFGFPAAAVDGNVIRVLSRLRALSGDPSKMAAVHTALANELLDRERPGCYNQALMELGATVCRPVNPNCDGCPVRGACKAVAEWEAYLAGGGSPDADDAPRVTQYPGRKAVKEKREQSVAVTVLEVICTSPARAADTAVADGAAGRAASGDAAAAAAPAQQVQPPRKRQRTMQDFALAAAARKQQQQQAASDKVTVDANDSTGNAAPCGGATPGGGAASLEALVARGTRHYLLTVRPQGGLLAGLWEFPGVVLQQDAAEGDDAEEADDQDSPSPLVPAATSTAERQKVCDSLLRRLLGSQVLMGSLDASGASASATTPAAAGKQPAPSVDGHEAPHGVHNLRVLGRHEMGQYVHVFSHIRQTNYIQRVTALFEGDFATLARFAEASATAGAAAGGATDGSKSANDTGSGTTAASGNATAEDSKAEGKPISLAAAVATGSGAAKKRVSCGKRGKKSAAAELETATGGGASIMWVTRQQIEGEGLPLSSGVRKIFQQAVGASDGVGGLRATAKAAAGKVKAAGGKKGGGKGAS